MAQFFNKPIIISNFCIVINNNFKNNLNQKVTFSLMIIVLLRYVKYKYYWIKYVTILEDFQKINFNCFR